MKFVEALLFRMSKSEENMLGQANQGACLGTVVDDQSTLIVRKA